MRDWQDDVSYIVSRNAAWPLKGDISMRLLDWTVTNFAKASRLCILQADGCVFEVYKQYRQALRKLGRSQFDPFNREGRLTTWVEGREVRTSRGQINFLAWATRYGVIDFVMQHMESIARHKHDVNKSHKSKRKGADGKRQVICCPQAACGVVTLLCLHGVQHSWTLP